jgi:hypothetical protein
MKEDGENFFLKKKEKKKKKKKRKRKGENEWQHQKGEKMSELF